MNLGSWIVLALVAVAVAFAIRSIVRDRNNGDACAGCSGCSGGTKPTSCPATDDMVRRMEQSAQ